MLSRSFATSALGVALALSLLPGLADARSHGTPTPAATATPTPPPEDPAITLVAKREFVAWQAGIVNPSHYASQSQSGLAQDRVTQISKELGQAGSLEKAEYLAPVVVDDVPGAKGYLYKMTCANGVIYERLIFAPDGKIAGVVFRDKPPE